MSPSYFASFQHKIARERGRERERERERESCKDYGQKHEERLNESTGTRIKVQRQNYLKGLSPKYFLRSFSLNSVNKIR